MDKLKLYLSEIYHVIREILVEKTEMFFSLKEKGIYVLPNFLSETHCNSIISKFLDITDKSNVSNDDTRVFYAEKLIDEMDLVLKNTQLNGLIKSYIGPFAKKSTMINNTIYRDGGLGSGGGWHRDSALRRQLKFILYLSNVELSNGPFEYIEGSHKRASKILLSKEKGLKLRTQRFDTLPKSLHSKPILGKKGTLIIVDTSGLHRGMPVLEGERFALTEYIFDFKIPQSYAQHSR